MLRIRLRYILFLLLPGNVRRQRIPNFLRQLTTSILSRVFLSVFRLTINKYSFFLLLRDLRELITCTIKESDNKKKMII
jgi:hypothetical protein